MVSIGCYEVHHTGQGRDGSLLRLLELESSSPSFARSRFLLVGYAAIPRAHASIKLYRTHSAHKVSRINRLTGFHTIQHVRTDDQQQPEPEPEPVAVRSIGRSTLATAHKERRDSDQTQHTYYGGQGEGLGRAGQVGRTGEAQSWGTQGACIHLGRQGAGGDVVGRIKGRIDWWMD